MVSARAEEVFVGRIGMWEDLVGVMREGGSGFGGSDGSESEPQARRGRCSRSRWQTRSQETFHLLQKQPQCPDPNHSKSDCGKPFLHQKAEPGVLSLQRLNHPLQPE